MTTNEMPDEICAYCKMGASDLCRCSKPLPKDFIRADKAAQKPQEVAEAIENFPITKRHPDGFIKSGSMACYEWVHKYGPAIIQAAARNSKPTGEQRARALEWLASHFCQSEMRHYNTIKAALSTPPDADRSVVEALEKIHGIVASDKCELLSAEELQRAIYSETTRAIAKLKGV